MVLAGALLRFVAFGYGTCFVLFVLRDIWFVSSTGQPCPEGRSTNRTRSPMRGAACNEVAVVAILTEKVVQVLTLVC